jgi:hypothetical protein
MAQQQSNGSSHTLALCAGAGACFLAGWTAHAAFRSGWRPTAHHDASSKRQPAHLQPTHVSGGDTPSQSPSAASTPRGGYPASLTEQNGHKMALLVRTDITLVSKPVPSPFSPKAKTAHTPDELRLCSLTTLLRTPAVRKALRSRQQCAMPSATSWHTLVLCRARDARRCCALTVHYNSTKR